MFVRCGLHISDRIVEAAVPIATRAERSRQRNIEVENLFNLSRAQDESNAAQQNHASRSASYNQPIFNRKLPVLADKDVGVPLSQEALEGQVPSAYGATFRRSLMSKNPDVNEDTAGLVRARTDAQLRLARQRAGNPTTGQYDALDARKLGSRPEAGKILSLRESTANQRNLGVRQANGKHREEATRIEGLQYGKDTMGLEPRQRYPTSSPRQSPASEQTEAPRRSFPRDDSNYQGQSTQGIHFRRFDLGAEGRYDQANRRQSGTNDRPVRENVPSGRGSRVRRGGAQGSGGGRPRVSRKGGDGEPQSRKRNKEASRGNDFGRKISAEETYNEDERRYMKEETEKKSTKSTHFEPKVISPETFSGLGPALGSGEQGISEILGAKIHLAQRILEGEYVEWYSKEQKADVMTIVNVMKRKRKSDAASSPSTEAEHQTQGLLQKLLGGRYEVTKPQQDKDILGHVARHADRNESYYPTDQQSLLEKVRSIMPAGNTTKARVT